MSYSEPPPPPPPPSGPGGPGAPGGGYGGDQYGGGQYGGGQYGGGQYGGGAYGGGYGGYSQPQTSKKAIWALVTGILSILCCGVFAGVPAVILGSMAKKEIAASNGAQTGRGMAQTGFVLGIISFVLTVIYVILLLTGNANFSFSTGTNS